MKKIPSLLLALVAAAIFPGHNATAQVPENLISELLADCPEAVAEKYAAPLPRYARVLPAQKGGCLTHAKGRRTARLPSRVARLAIADGAATRPLRAEPGAQEFYDF